MKTERVSHLNKASTEAQICNPSIWEAKAEAGGLFRVYGQSELHRKILKPHPTLKFEGHHSETRTPFKSRDMQGSLSGWFIRQRLLPLSLATCV